MAQLPTFIHGRLALLGDAAHPFLPHQGQGGGQAIEDAVALAALLPLGTQPHDIPDRLQLYNSCRYERSHKIQQFTRTAGKDASELAAAGQRLDMMEYQKYNFGHDAHDFATNKLRLHLAAQDPSTRYRSPYGFGPSPGPRQPLNLPSAHSLVQTPRLTNPETSRTISIRLKTSRTYLETLFPPNSGFSFASPGTLASASISCTTLSNMTWLGGGGYNHCGLYIHGVQYTKRDGSKLFGTFLAVLFENFGDPILTGREELGMPKLFCDIDVDVKGEEEASVALSWRGAKFGEIKVSGLAEPAAGATAPATAPTATTKGPPAPPEEQGLFAYRYIPAVGHPGKADAEYPVFVPNLKPAAPRVVEGGGEQSPPRVLSSKTAEVTFEECDWHNLPTLHHVAKRLAEIPIYGVEEAKVVWSEGVDDVGGAVRIE